SGRVRLARRVAGACAASDAALQPDRQGGERRRRARGSAGARAGRRRNVVDGKISFSPAANATRAALLGGKPAFRGNPRHTVFFGLIPSMRRSRAEHDKRCRRSVQADTGGVSEGAVRELHALYALHGRDDEAPRGAKAANGGGDARL